MKEKIIEILNDASSALSYAELFTKLSECFSGEELDKVSKVLDEMSSKAEIYHTTSNKYTLYEKCENVFVGELDINTKGHGFVCKTGLPYDIHISPEKVSESGAIYGDKVECIITNEYLKDKSRKAYDGNRITKIIKRDLTRMVGTISRINGRPEFIPDDDKYNIKLIINPKTCGECVDGSKVVVKINEQIGKREDNIFTADVVKVLGHKDDPGIDIESVAASLGIFNEFSSKAMEEVAQIPDHVLEEEKQGRKDYTDLNIITIDDKDTKDRDDAIYIERDGDGYNLSVHIADVSHYVKPGSALDACAYEKGNSYYPAGKVFPMLPHELSNGICSLNENVERLTLSVEVKLNKRAEVVDSDIHLGVIKNKKVMNYDDVNKVLVDGIVPNGYEPFVDMLQVMRECSDIRTKTMKNKGSLDFDIPEPKIIQDANGVCIDVKNVDHGVSGKIIENFMVIANVCVATLLFHLSIPAVYRVHDLPKEEKLQMFLDFCDKMGLSSKLVLQNFDSKTLTRFLDKYRDRDDFFIISSYLLRSMSKAVYSESNIGHFGLAQEFYLHFTSPIRRYPDLSVHRVVKNCVIEKDMSPKTLNYYASIFPSVALHCSNTEQNAQELEREVDSMKMAEYMEHHLNEEHDGLVTSVLNNGFFVRFDDKPIEGFVPVSTLKDDHYTYYQDGYALIGQKVDSNGNRKIYRPGTRVKVIVVAASKLTSTIDCEIVDPTRKKTNESHGERRNGNFKQRIKF